MSDKSADTLELPPLAGPASQASGPAKPKAAKVEENLSNLALAAAGLAVLDALIAVGYIVLWTVQPRLAMAIIQAMAGVSLLLGISPIVVGGLMLNENRRTYTVMPGTSWANVGIMSGLLLLSATVIIPLVSALSVLVGSSDS